MRRAKKQMFRARQMADKPVRACAKKTTVLSPPYRGVLWPRHMEDSDFILDATVNMSHVNRCSL